MNVKTRNNGFVMLLVLCFFALVGIYMIVLVSDANTFIFQADRAYLEACRQNLTASGLSWAKKNGSASKTAIGPIEIDTADMGIKNSALSIKLSAAEKDKYVAEICTSCSKARQRLSSVKKFTIETRP